MEPYLIQALLPLIANEDEAVHLATLRVIESLSAAMKTATKEDLRMVWSHLKGIITNPHAQESILEAAIAIMQTFPIANIESAGRVEVGI